MLACLTPHRDIHVNFFWQVISDILIFALAYMKLDLMTMINTKKLTSPSSTKVLRMISISQVNISQAMNGNLHGQKKEVMCIVPRRNIKYNKIKLNGQLADNT
jgi:hypothetical protein